MKHNGDRCQPLERPHFVTGQILTADDLRAEQDYQRELAAGTIGCVTAGASLTDSGCGGTRLRLESWSGLDLRSVRGETRSVFTLTPNSNSVLELPRVELRLLRYGRRRPWSVRSRSLILRILTRSGTRECARVSSLLFSTTCPVPTSTCPTEDQQLGWPGGGCAGMCPD